MTTSASFHCSLLSSGGEPLVRIDDSSSDKSLILGRASLRDGLTRKDPFFSRNHARLEVVDAEEDNLVVKLIPIHQNPCYVVRRLEQHIVEVRLGGGKMG